jgi:DNA-binding CsgD family transcriptional regulator
MGSNSRRAGCLGPSQEHDNARGDETDASPFAGRGRRAGAIASRSPHGGSAPNLDGLAHEVRVALSAQHPIDLVHSSPRLREKRSAGNPNKLGVFASRPMLDGMATERARARCRERLERLSESDLDCESMRREAVDALQRVIGFDRWCWPLADPETLLPSSGMAEHDFGPRVPRSLELEYSEDDFAAKHILARRANSAGSLSGETGGDLARSARWDQVMRPVGIGDVAGVACRDALGCWGWIEAYRDHADRAFEQEDLDLLADVGPAMGSALRRSAMLCVAASVVEPSPPGVIVLDRELRLVSWTAGARAWIEALPSAELYVRFGMLPSVIYPAATRARSKRAAAGAHALLRAVDGRWLVIEAAPLEGHEDGEIAVNLRAAAATETFGLLCRTYALSKREREIVELLVAGLDTRAITKRLFISRYTVQDHLKSVFDKIGIHSRRELLAKLTASPDSAQASS